MAKLLNMVQQTVSAVASAGVGTLTLSAAQAGYDSMAGAGAVDTGVYSYCIQEGVKWEVGRGTYTVSGTTFARTTITRSSAGTATAETFTTNAILVITPLLVDFTPAANTDIWVGTDNDKFVTSAGLMAGAAFVALTDGATISFDMNTGVNRYVTIAGNRTLANPTNTMDGESGVILVTQDGTGSRTLAYGTNWKFAGGTPTLSTAAGTVDMIAWVVHGTTVYATLAKAFA